MLLICYFCVDIVIEYPVWLWIHLIKNADHTDAGYRQPFGLAHGSSPLSPTARGDQSLSPSANCSRSRFVVAKFNFRIINKSLEYLHAAPKRLRQQLASVTSESDELRERKLASAWSAFFRVRSEAREKRSRNKIIKTYFFRS